MAEETKSAPLSADGAAVADVFSCRRCRTVLCSSTDLQAHTPAAQQFSYHRQVKTNRQRQATVADAGDEYDIGGAAPSPPKPTCDSLFLTEAPDWMGLVEGRVLCPKCQGRVGNMKWAGMQCSCTLCS